MPNQKKNYTNADIIKRLDMLDGRLQTIEIWKVSQDAGKAAVDEYRRQENSNKMNKEKTDIYENIKSVFPYIIAVLVALAAVLYVHTNGSGK